MKRRAAAVFTGGVCSMFKNATLALSPGVYNT